MAKITGVLIALALGLLLPSSAQAAFPGQNGLIAFSSSGSGGPYVETIAQNGTGRTVVRRGSDPAWSADGSRIAFWSPDAGTQGGIATMTPDGTLLTTCPCGGQNIPYESWGNCCPNWSPDGRIVIASFYTCACDVYDNKLYVFNPDGGPSESGPSQVTNIAAGNWSPDGSKVYLDGYSTDGDYRGGLFSWQPGSGQYDELPGGGGGAEQFSPTASPDGQRVAFTQTGPSGDIGIYSIRTDGTGLIRLSGPAPTKDQNPTWSPDNTKIAFSSSRDGNSELYVMNTDGSNQTRLTNTPTVNEDNPDWQPSPAYTGYGRPKAATPMDVPLVPAYADCASPNRAHGGGLTYGSCAPAQQTSSHATVGTGDSNGHAAASTGHVKLTVLPGDLALTVNITDVRDAGTLGDYGGELRLLTTVRATDKLSTTAPGSTGNATVIDTGFGPPVPCAADGDPTTGSTCSISTTVNALIPGLIVTGARSNWQFEQMRLYDGGSDGDGDTTADNTLFATQGIFVP